MNGLLSEASVWNDPDKAQELNKERSFLEKILLKCNELNNSINDISELLDLAILEEDVKALKDISKEISINDEDLFKLEFQRMFECICFWGHKY